MSEFETFNKFGPDGPPPETDPDLRPEIIFQSRPDTFGVDIRIFADGGVESRLQGGHWKWMAPYPAWAVAEMCTAYASLRRTVRELLPICDGDCGCGGENLGCVSLQGLPEDADLDFYEEAISEANRNYDEED